MLTPLMQGAFDLTVKADQPRYFLTVSMLAPTWLQSRFLPVRKNRRAGFGDKFLQPHGTISSEIMPDFLHPSSKGHQLRANAVHPILDPYLSAK